MYYQLYGIQSISGSNVLLGAFRSRKKALDAVKDINCLVYPYFTIAERERKNSIVLGYESGKTRDGYATRSTLAVVPNPKYDIINNHDAGSAYWKTFVGV